MELLRCGEAVHVTSRIAVVLEHRFLPFFISFTEINVSRPTEFQLVYCDCSDVKHFNYDKMCGRLIVIC